MAVDPKDPFLSRVLRAKNKATAEALLERILDEEAKKYRDALRESLIKQFGINAAYFGKRAVDKVWEWFKPPMDFSAQPTVMPGTTMSVSIAGGNSDQLDSRKSKSRRNQNRRRRH